MDSGLIAAVRDRLYSAVISDVLDSLGYRDHAMIPQVRPLDESLVMFGRARTANYMAVYHVEEHVNPYELEIALVDDLQPDDVVVLACPPDNRITPWGELLSTAASARRAAGCVTDGLVRDVRLIRDMRFPVFAAGIGPLDTKGRGMVMQIDIPVHCGGVAVEPGDWVFGDVDGVVVIPQALTEKAIELALGKMTGEDTVRRQLAAGEKLKDVFARNRIL
jgi:regulator of RNase E activity RraA